MGEAHKTKSTKKSTMMQKCPSTRSAVYLVNADWPPCPFKLLLGYANLLRTSSKRFVYPAMHSVASTFLVSNLPDEALLFAILVSLPSEQRIERALIKASELNLVKINPWIPSTTCTFQDTTIILFLSSRGRGERRKMETKENETIVL